MSDHRVTPADSSRLSERHDGHFPPEYQSGRSGIFKVSGQENTPRGLNESYYRESAAALGMPMEVESRSHSVPPPTSAVVGYHRSPSMSSSRSSSRSDRSRSPARSYPNVSRDSECSPDSRDQTRGLIQSNFSGTRAGIGAGIVGAVIGGLVAKQASEAAFRHNQKKTGRPRRHSSEAIPSIASTVLGAVAGALGANAVTHRLEDARQRNRRQQLTWEERCGREENLRPCDTGRRRPLSHRNSKGYVYDIHDYD
ncbi:uncharacterized protein MAM_04217 [Metarhizium album ARSEF 1941]|uniref:Uncharacterized protein n=1 Tax=Metarhizium album (strain ARSEF 1941) TaxID=1081103 RepID=A0A0B2WUT0_METAS|nr:uncharacterized protein MAM_04217 [Metarhizium album ARSEF 1941]KHN97828.1 hypothetical protein MAM_04217 [Metarhizium album ARSEF 1941]